MDVENVTSIPNADTAVNSRISWFWLFVQSSLVLTMYCKSELEMETVLSIFYSQSIQKVILHFQPLR